MLQTYASMINISCINDNILQCFAKQNVCKTIVLAITLVDNKFPFVTSNSSQINISYGVAILTLHISRNPWKNSIILYTIPLLFC